MDKDNAEKCLKIIKPTDKVLDIGGFGGAFNRANFVIDINPYEKRHHWASVGGKECFTKETWIRADCNFRLPFKNKEFDFVTCSHVLEDIRDPIHLCSELKRIAKRGYLEFPSPEREMSRGVEGIITGRGFVGNAHHHWIIEKKDNELIFTMKKHFLSGDLRYSIPYKKYKKFTEAQKIDYIFFDSSTFRFSENFIWNEIEEKKRIAKVMRERGYRNKFFWLMIDLKDAIIMSLLKLKGAETEWRD